MQKRIIDILIKNPQAGRKEIASTIDNITEDGVKYNLGVLQAKGLIQRIGPDKGGHWEVIAQEKVSKFNSFI